MYKIYIYDLTNTVIAQIDEVLDVEVSKKINDVSTASFGVYHTNEFCKRDILKEYRRCKINLQDWNIEKTLFDGVIRGIEANLDATSIKCESFEHYFDRRILQNTYTYTWATIDAILTAILNDINTIYNTNITLDCWITTTTSKTYNKGETFLKVLKDLAGLWYEFIVDNMVLKFKQTIWIDRTSGENFVEYRYDINEPDFRSIDSIKMTTDWKEFANGVLWKSGTNYTYLNDATSISEFWLIQTTLTNSWDQATETQTYLDDHKISISEFDVWAITQNFFEADLGDLVAVYVFVWNDILFFDWSMKVVQKSYKWWDLQDIKFILSKGTMTSKNIIDRIAEIGQRVKTLELK